MNATGGSQYELRWPRIGAVVAVALVVGFLVWLLAIRDGDEDSDTATTTQAPLFEAFGPEVATADELQDVATEVGHEIYWAGAEEEGEVELTLTSDGRVFVRYLSGGAKPGAERADFLTVATYQLVDAQAATQATAERPGRESFETPTGGLAVFNPDDPGRVYFVEPGSDLQVEVFHPDRGRAREHVESGQIEPIG